MKGTPKLVDPTPTELDFLRTELDTGMTLAGIALNASHREKSDRNCANARKAYDAVLHFAARVNLSAEESDEIKSKLEHLKSRLKLLGEEL